MKSMSGVSAKQQVLYNRDLLKSLSEDGGLKTIEKMVSGEISSGGLCKALKIDFKEVTHGKMRVECEYDPALHSNPFGIANGGWHGAMLDNAAGYAGLSTAPAGFGAFTREMSVIRFYRPVVQGVFSAQGYVVEQIDNKVLCKGEITDQSGAVYADAELVLSIKPIEEIRQSFEQFGIELL